ncbi:unnamed protein product [Sphenostylis stenocarpa]|uniref:Uncharacterized protein n=1 Tax=Sphenostylis stenocarpa TaxID=92480 RepID=A0AA86S136_9FABA|nr:unnamed protein product [Sphenostylis stenocarpa]
METSERSESIMNALSNLMGPTFSSRALSSNGPNHTRNKRKCISKNHARSIQRLTILFHSFSLLQNLQTKEKCSRTPNAFWLKFSASSSSLPFADSSSILFLFFQKLRFCSATVIFPPSLLGLTLLSILVKVIAFVLVRFLGLSYLIIWSGAKSRCRGFPCLWITKEIVFAWWCFFA